MGKRGGRWRTVVVREVVNGATYVLSTVASRAIDPSGYEAGKKIKGKKRHIVVDSSTR